MHEKLETLKEIAIVKKHFLSIIVLGLFYFKSTYCFKLEIRDSQNLAKLGLGGQFIWSEGMG